MNATTNFTVKSLRANKVRTLVTIAGVALAAALLTAVLTTYASLNDFLYRNEAALAGTWMACVEADDSSVLDERITGAQADPQVFGTAIMRDIGFAELTADQQDTQGTYLAIRSIEGDVGDICGIEPSEGRLPESDREIMLFATWNDYGGVSLGDTVTFNVGQRVARLAPGEEGSMSAGTMSASWGVQEEAHESEITDGTPLNSSMGVLEADIDGGIFNEEATNTEERTYTVVGFYDRPGYALSTAAGMVGVTAGAAAPRRLYRRVPHAERRDQHPAGGRGRRGAVPRRARGAAHGHAALHGRFQRLLHLDDVLRPGRGAGGGHRGGLRVAHLRRLQHLGSRAHQAVRASVLGGRVAPATAPRRGAGRGHRGRHRHPLRASHRFGRVRRHLRRLGAGARPAGRIGGSSLPRGRERLGAAGGLGAHLRHRARVRVDSGEAGESHEHYRLAAGRQWQPRFPARGGSGREVHGALVAVEGAWGGGRVLGVGGMLARISRKRGTGKGRAASVSLALAIVLLMTAGSLSVFLGTLTDVVTGGGELAGEVGVMAQLDVETPQGEGTADGDVQAGNDGATGADSAATQPAAPMTPEAVAAANNELFARQAEVFAGAFHDLSQVAGAEPVGWKMGTGLYAMLPEAMAGEALVDQENGMGGKMADGRVDTVGSVAYLDDAAFDDYAKSLGLDPADFRDPAHLRAIALAQGYGNNGSVYQLLNVLREPGTLEALTAATYHGEPAAGIGVGATSGEGNSEAFAFQPYLEGDDDGVEWFPLEEAEVQTVSVEVVALAEEAPAIASARGEGLQLIVPESVAAYQSFGNDAPIFYGYFDSADGDHGALAEELATAGSAYFHDKSPYGLAFYSFNDYIEQRDSNQMIATVVNVFCLLFAVILALIAMANVFNTVTNSLILRRREFAVMKSVGLSNRQFRAMVAEECVAWCVRGLVPGVLLSLFVSFLLWQVISGSMTGLPFTLPWSYVALAAAMTVVAVGASVAYGMHRCRADNVVEALRADAV